MYDEIQFSGGSTFGLKGVIKLPNEDFEGDNMARLDMMMRDTRLMVYTLERVDAPVKTPTKGVIEFWGPVNGLCWMVGEEGVGTHSALELYPMVQNQPSMIIGLESAEGVMVKYKVNARALESLLHKFSLKVDSLAKAS